MQAKAAEWKMDVTITQRRDGDNNLAHHRRAGDERPRQGLAVLPQAGRDRRSESLLRRRSRPRISSPAPATPAKTATKSCCPPARPKALWNKLLGCRRRPLRPRRPRHLRLEAGMNLYGRDMDETVSPLDAGLAGPSP